MKTTKQGTFKRTPEMNRRMSEALKNRVFSKIHIERLRIASTGKKHSEESKEKMRLKRKGTQTGEKNNFFGKKHSLETLQKTSGKNASNWQGGIYPENFKIRHSPEYKLWRKAVFERDNYTCIWCYEKSEKGKAVILNADHIKPFAYYPELRFAIDNGRTLCVKCHRTTDTYGSKIKK